MALLKNRNLSPNPSVSAAAWGVAWRNVGFVVGIQMRTGKMTYDRAASSPGKIFRGPFLGKDIRGSMFFDSPAFQLLSDATKWVEPHAESLRSN